MEIIEIRPGDFPLGSIQSRAAARALIAATENQQHNLAKLGNLTDDEQVAIEVVDNPRVAELMVRLIRVAGERAVVYGKPLNFPTPEAIRHRRAIIKEINRMTGGQALSLEMRDHVEWNRLTAVAEENLRSKGKK
jgi:hypothetical protein